MEKRKQVRESIAINTINKIVKSGRSLTGVVYNGQPSDERYVMIKYIEPIALTV